MKPDTFYLEEYFSRYEFASSYLLCCSDPETFSLETLLEMATPEEHTLWKHLQLGYTEVPGLPALRETIASHFYPNLQVSNIICSAGIEEAIFCTLFSLCSEKDHAIIITPCYQSLLEIPKITGCSITTIELQESEGWQLDLNQVESAIRPNTRWMIINYPHNPTGQILSSEKLQALIAILDKRGIYLVSDEAYRLLGPFDTPWPHPAASLYPRAISIGGTSKSFGLPGLRMGWVAAQETTLLKEIQNMKLYTSISNSSPSEILSLIAIRNKYRLIGRNNQIISKNLSLLSDFITRYNSLFSWVVPQGGSVGFVRYHSEESTDEFCKRLVEYTGILLLPGSVYQGKTNHFRIGFGRANMPEILLRLEAYLAKANLGR